jgi:hypothetical protein
MQHLTNFSRFTFLLENSSGTEKGNSVNSAYEKRFSCIPKKVLPFVVSVAKDVEGFKQKLGVDLPTLILLTKATVGILGRETQFGNYTEKTDIASEFARDELNLGPLIDWGLKTFSTKTGKKFTQSLGMGQITPEFWSRHNLEKKIGSYNESFDDKSQGLAVLYGLADRYKLGLQKGLKKQPSVNPVLQKYGLITGINGTGNNVLDLAIVGHNMGEKIMTLWCKTNHPLYAAPKEGGSKYSPFQNKESFNPKSKLLAKIQDPSLKKFPGELTVKLDEVIPNFFPNLKGPGHTAIGYVEDVAKYMKQFSCLDSLGTK